MAKPASIDITDLEKRFTSLLVSGDLERGLRHGRDMIAMLCCLEAKIDDLEHRVASLHGKKQDGCKGMV